MLKQHSKNIKNTFNKVVLLLNVTPFGKLFFLALCSNCWDDVALYSQFTISSTLDVTFDCTILLAMRVKFIVSVHCAVSIIKDVVFTKNCLFSILVPCNHDILANGLLFICLVRTTLSVSLTTMRCLISIEGWTASRQKIKRKQTITELERKFKHEQNMTMHTLYIKVNCCWVRCSYRVAGCTTIWPWASPLYVRYCIFWSIMKHSCWTIRLDPFPRGAGVWVGSGHWTDQCSCLSLNHSVWIWCIIFNLWFICFNLSYFHVYL